MTRFIAPLLVALFCLSTLANSSFATPINELKSVVKEAFIQMHDGFSSDEVILNDELFDLFIAECQEELPDTEIHKFGWTLINLRKAGKLSDVEVTKRNQTDVASVIHIAEIVSRSMLDQHQVSIDRIMVDMKLREEFDARAIEAFGEAADLYAIRKASFRLRKTRRLRPELITRLADWGREIQTFKLVEVENDFELVSDGPGIYIFRDPSGYLYIGESRNLRERLQQHFDQSSNASLASYLRERVDDKLTIELHVFDPESRIKEVAVRRAYESELIESRKPKFNLSNH